MVETLRKSIEWRRQLDAGEVATQADIARREGVTRARVPQVLVLLRLTQEIQERLLALPPTTTRFAISEHHLRPITLRQSLERQTAAFEQLVREH